MLCDVCSGVCYAEFGVRVPKTTGSAYTYSYVTVGEFVAFFIGWNLILEYLIGTAAGASALSSMFDSLANHTISHYMITHLGTLRGLGKNDYTYPDLLALFIVLLVTAIIALGVRNSVGFNNVLNVVNLVVWVFMIIAGLFFISARNWEGGNFLPYGWSGVMQGAATCFYAFIGFDIIATTGEEAKDPHTSIPYAITASLVTCLTAYVSVSVILTLMVPFDLIDGSAPLLEMFAVHGFVWGKYVVAVGAVAGLTVSLLGSLFPMPRVIYAMSRDGLLFRFLSHISAFTHTPAVACVISGSFAAILALLVSLRDLIEMMSIGTLLAYTLVSLCILLLRYQPDETTDTHQFRSEDGEDIQQLHDNFPTKDDNRKLMDDENSSYHAGGAAGEGDESDFHTGHAPLLKRVLGGHYYTLRLRLGMPDATARPTPASGRTVTRCTLSFFLCSFFMWASVIFGVEQGSGFQAVVSGFVAALTAGTLVKLMVTILQQPESPRRLPYMAPCVPFVPAAAILVNTYLMLKLRPLTWIRFTIWCLIGLLIYCFYGVWHSTLELHTQQEQAQASTYQRYDDHLDDTFSPEFQPEEGDGERPYQGWSAPEERGYNYTAHPNQPGQDVPYEEEEEEEEEEGYGYQSARKAKNSRGRTNRGFFDEDD
ncbi:unnamed protein product [Knipowitschia caucasica]